MKDKAINLSKFIEASNENNEPKKRVEKFESPWVSVHDHLPEPGKPVLALVKGCRYRMVLELRWERCNPMIEPYFKDFCYWDCPHDDGKDLDGKVRAWMPIPPAKLEIV